AVVFRDAAMRIPRIHVLVHDRTTVELYQANTPFDQPSRHQALTPERLGYLLVEAVELLGFLALLTEIHGLRSARLHPVRQFVRGDPRREVRYAGILFSVILVHPGEMVQPPPLLFYRHVLTRRGKIEDRIADRPEHRSLIRRRQESGAPVR